MSLEQSKDQEIPGYVHPDAANTSRNSTYKTFTEGEKKNKSYGPTTTATKYSNYENYGKEQNHINTKCSARRQNH
jgi:hypothetical protein